MKICLSRKKCIFFVKMCSVEIFENDKAADKIPLLLRQYIEIAVFSTEINYLEMACCWPVPKDHDMIIYVLQEIICFDAPSGLCSLYLSDLNPFNK